MMYSPEELTQLAIEYCRKHGIELRRSLGQGVQGIVYATSRNSAIKIHGQLRAYNLEKNAYLRLAARRTSDTRPNGSGIALPRR